MGPPGADTGSQSSVIGCTRDAPFAGVTRTGAGGPAGGGVGLGLRPPLAYIDPLEIKRKEAVNSKQPLVPNIVIGRQSPAATEI